MIRAAERIVKDIQIALKFLTYLAANHPIDGIFNNVTLEALKVCPYPCHSNEFSSSF